VWTLTEETSDSPVVRAVPDFGPFYQREYRPVLGVAYALTGDMSSVVVPFVSVAPVSGVAVQPAEKAAIDA